MTLRATRQYLAVLGSGSGKARITRQYVEVLGTVGVPTWDVAAESTLVLIDAAAAGFVRLVAAEGTVPLSDTGEGAGMLSVIDTLTVVEEASCTCGFAQPGTDILSPTDEAEMQMARTRTASDTLAITQAATYIGPRWADASDLLALTEESRLCDTFEMTAASTLALSDQAASSGTRRVNAASVLALQSLADNRVFVRSAVSELELTQTAVGDRILRAASVLTLADGAVQGQFAVWATSQLVLSETARPGPILRGAADQLALTDLLTCNMHMAQATSVLTLGQTLHGVVPHYVVASDVLTTTEDAFDLATLEWVTLVSGLQDAATTLQSGPRTPGAQYISFADQAAVTNVRAAGLAVDAADTLACTDSAITNLTGGATDALSLTQAATGPAGRPLGDSLPLTDVGSVVKTVALAAESILSLTQAFAAYRPTRVRDQYNPFVGETAPGLPTPPPTTLAGPIPGAPDTVRLMFPAAVPLAEVTDSLDLRSPSFGNKDRLSFNRIQRETRGGTLVVFADPIWPKTQTLVLSFSGLSRTQGLGLLTFVRAHVGREIGLLDWEQRYWRGVITNPNDPVVEDSRGSFTASFEFEGELFDWIP